MTWILYGFDFGAGTSAIFALPLHQVLGLPRFLSQFIAEFGIDILDKVITLIAVFFVLKAMPLRLLSRLPLGHVYIKEPKQSAGDDDE
jgi:energy-coupling factor transport system substrate-specific component